MRLPATTLAIVLTTLASFARAETFAGYMGRPVVVDGGPALRVVISYHDLSGEASFSILSQDETSGWKTEMTRGGRCRAAAAADELLYVFGDGGYTVYHKDQWVRSPAWTLAWAVSASVGGDDVWAFGTGRQGEAYFIGAAELQGSRWFEPANHPTCERPCRNVSAARLRGVPYVFWSCRQAGASKDSIYYAPVTSAGWGEPATLEGVARSTRIAVCGGDRLWLWQHDATRCLSEKRPLTCRSFDGQTWSEPLVITGLSDPRFDRTIYLAAGLYRGRPAAITASRQVVKLVAQAESGRGWDAPVVLYSMPYAVRVEVLLGFGLLFGLLTIGVGVSMWRAHGRDMTLQTPDGPRAVAPWRLRAIAMLFDSSLIMLVCLLWVFLMSENQRVGDFVGLAVALQILSVPYFAAAEMSMGQTPGKKLVGIVVVNLNGSRPAPWQIIVRSLLRVLDSFLLAPVGLLFILNTRNAQRLGDLVAGTVVVKVAALKDEQAEPPQDDFFID